jgi:hypothetical protein
MVMLGDWLLGKGKITEEQLARALQDQTFFGGRLGNSLIKLGYLDEHTLGEYLADVAHCPYAPPERLESIPPEVIAAVPSRLAARYRIVPIAIRGRRLQLAMCDPKDLIALDEIAFLTGLTIEPYVATEFRIVRSIEQHYGVALETRTIPVSGGVPSEPHRPAPPVDPGPAGAARAPAGGPPELGLDGLPLDAEIDPSDQPFVTAGGNAPAAETPEPPPASLDEWRMAQEDVPLEFPTRPARASTPAPRTATPSVARAVSPAAVTAPARPAATAAPTGAPTLEVVSARLRAAETRDDVFDAVLDYAAAEFRRAALLVVQQDRVIGWSGRGEGLSPGRIRNVVVSLDRPSLFIFFRTGGDYYYGPVPDLPANARFYLDLGIPPPARVLLLPLTIKDRPSVILYADQGSATGKAPDVQTYRRLLRKAAIGLEVLILRNKLMMI